MESNWIGITGLIVGLGGVVYGVIADVARRNQRDWVYTALFRLIPLIEEANRLQILASINNIVDSLKPPKKMAAGYDG